MCVCVCAFAVVLTDTSHPTLLSIFVLTVRDVALSPFLPPTCKAHTDIFVKATPASEETYFKYENLNDFSRLGKESEATIRKFEESAEDVFVAGRPSTASDLAEDEEEEMATYAVAQSIVNPARVKEIQEVKDAMKKEEPKMKNKSEMSLEELYQHNKEHRKGRRRSQVSWYFKADRTCCDPLSVFKKLAGCDGLFNQNKKPQEYTDKLSGKYFCCPPTSKKNMGDEVQQGEDATSFNENQGGCTPWWKELQNGLVEYGGHVKKTPAETALTPGAPGGPRDKKYGNSNDELELPDQQRNLKRTKALDGNHVQGRKLIRKKANLKI